MKNGVLPDSITELLTCHRLGVLATSDNDGPHASLVSVAFAADYSYLVFPTLRSTRKYANIVRNRRVSVLFDNREHGAKPDTCYALTLSGPADCMEAPDRTEPQAAFLMVHPHLREFLLLPDTALIKVMIEKVQFVEGVQRTREFNVASGSW